MRQALSAIVLLAALAATGAAEVPGALIVLDVPFTTRAGQVADAAPARFVLLADGRAFIGGAADVEFVQLDKAALEALRREAAALRQPGKGKKARSLPWLSGPRTWSFGPGEQRARISFAADAEAKLPPLTLETSGDPASAPEALRPLADMVGRLSNFYHPHLRPYRPAEYRLSVSEGSMNGGCRPPGSLQGHLDAAAFRPVTVPASAANGWPHGATAALVCREGKRMIVTLRPLLPGEM